MQAGTRPSQSLSTVTGETRALPGSHPATPGNPFRSVLTTAKTPAPHEPPVLGTQGTPGSSPARGQPPPPPQEVEPLPGPASKQLRRHPRPRPGFAPHSLVSPLGRQTQRRAAPRRGGRPGPLPSSSCLRDAQRSAALPALRPRGHTPYQPEATASSRAWGSLLPGGQAVHMATLRAPGGEETPAGRGERGTGSGRGQGVAVQPRGPSGANMAGGGGVSRSRRGRGNDGRRTAHRGRGHGVLVPGSLRFKPRPGS